MKNALGFGLGTLGRDMMYGMVSMYLMFYLTDVLDLSTGALAAVTVVLVLMRIFDAVNDPFMGYVVDNTRTRWGKFKPWITIGACGWCIGTVLLFTDWGVRGWQFITLFIVVYLVFEVAYTMNDISYYGMMPSLTRDKAERERIGVVTRICANIGLFSIVVGIVPVTQWLTGVLGDAQRSWQLLAIVLSVIAIAFQSITLIFAHETVHVKSESTPLRELVSVIFKNDQLLWVSLTFLLYMSGYTLLTSLGLHYFKYLVGDEGKYPIFALVLGVTQLGTLLVFPLISARMPRRQVFTLGCGASVVGYVVFICAGSSMVVILCAGLFLFFGEALFQVLLMMYIADSVEYGEWKLGRRNESITFSLQPFIYKLSGAISSGLMGICLIWSGVESATGPADVIESGTWIFRLFMMVVPLILTVAAFLVFRHGYRIDEATYSSIVASLQDSERTSTPKEEAR